MDHCFTNSKPKISTQCWVSVAPASTTLAQHWPIIRSKSGVCRTVLSSAVTQPPGNNWSLGHSIFSMQLPLICDQGVFETRSCISPAYLCDTHRESCPWRLLTPPFPEPIKLEMPSRVYDGCPTQSLIWLWHRGAAGTWKTKRQYLLTLQVSRYCLLALQGGTLRGNAIRSHRTGPSLTQPHGLASDLDSKAKAVFLYANSQCIMLRSTIPWKICVGNPIQMINSHIKTAFKIPTLRHYSNKM